MDITELLLLLAFVGLPLIQLILEKLGLGKKPPPPPPPLEDDQFEELSETVATPERAIPPNAEQGWSSGWGSWPGEALEELSSEEVLSEEKANELVALQERLSWKQIPEVARVAVPVVSMEPLVVDRAREHARFHATSSRPAFVAQRFARPSIDRSLRSSADLRHAIILAEVLGPPRSMREEGSK